MLADRRRAGDAQVGVDVDLADRHLRRLAEHFFGDSDRVRHLAAVAIDDLHEILRDGRRTVQNDGEAGEALFHFFQNIEAQLGLGAVAGADGDRQRIDAGFGRKFVYFVRIGELRVFGAYLHRVFNAGEFAEFRFDDHAVIVRVVHYLAGDADILFQRIFGSVDHDGRKSVFDAAFAQVEGVAVI